MTTPLRLRVTRRKVTTFVLLVVVLCLGGCESMCSDAPVLATHSPMHPQNAEAVTFEGFAEGTVDKIELAYERYSLTVSGGNITQTLAEAKTVVKTCDPGGNVNTLTCTHTMPNAFPSSSLIRFSATSWDGDGTRSTETYDFASGDYPLPDDPIPIRVKGDPTDHLDVVFIPDTDITLASFRDQLDEVIEDLYFKYATFKSYRGYYNFYYSGQQGNYEELCVFTNPPNMANLTAVGDSVAILHQTNLRDCKSGDRFSSEINYDKTLVHETGHALFDVKDEYCCDSSYSQQACVPNLYSSLANCQADAPNVGYPTTNCVQLTSATQTLNFWRIDPSDATGCMMGPAQHNAGSDFAEACERRIEWRYGKCGGGDCFPSPACP
jgi:hypothetical protein